MLVACAAAALAAAASRALGLAPMPAVLALAFCGTVVVYCLDRLRDLARDARTSPLRSAFVAAHRKEMQAGVALAASGALLAGVFAGARVVALAAGVAALGLAHRRLKRFVWAKPLYLTGSWCAVTIVLPAAAASTPPSLDRLALVALVVGATLQANVVLSNLRDAEGIAGYLGSQRALGLAASFAVAALLTCLIGPHWLRPLAALPVAMGAAIAGFRSGERYGALAVDGALLLGGLAALVVSA